MNELRLFFINSKKLKDTTSHNQNKYVQFYLKY